MLLPLRRHSRRCPHHDVLWHGWLHVGKDHRIELNLHLFFALTLMAVTWLLAVAVLPRLFPGWQPSSYWFVASTVAITEVTAATADSMAVMVATAASANAIEVARHRQR